MLAMCGFQLSLYAQLFGDMLFHIPLYRLAAAASSSTVTGTCTLHHYFTAPGWKVQAITTPSHLSTPTVPQGCNARRLVMQ
jgi:hypothetical protein